jgi:hypothetical protein
MDEKVGLVFNMTDCLSEDDDEDPHPVYLPDFFVYPCARGAEQIKYCSTPGNVPFSDVNFPIFLVPARATGGIHPVFQDRCSCGLIGQ